MAKHGDSEEDLDDGNADADSDRLGIESQNLHSNMDRNPSMK